MIAHPPALALVLVSLLSAGLMLWASQFALHLLRGWNLASGAATQIAMERKTYLVSTIVAVVLVLNMAALVLFAFTADRMAVMFIGAMCAIGTLNASPFGFPALFAKLALFFASAVWLVIHHADGKGRDYPYTRLKYSLLLAMAPVALLEAALSLSYFADLKADTVTSCCGKMFATAGRETLGSDLATLDPQLALTLLFGGLAALTILGLSSLRWRPLLLLFGLGHALFFAVAIAAIIAAIAVYVYEQPFHHCPFCILKPEYGYVGFALYLPLFAGTAMGLGSGVLGARRLPASLAGHGRVFERRLTLASIGLLLAFGALSAALIATSHLILLGA